MIGQLQNCLYFGQHEIIWKFVSCIMRCDSPFHPIHYLDHQLNYLSRCLLGIYFCVHCFVLALFQISNTIELYRQVIKRSFRLFLIENISKLIYYERWREIWIHDLLTIPVPMSLPRNTKLLPPISIIRKKN